MIARARDMQPTVTLILTEGNHRPRGLPVSSSRFTIGRGSDNDLVIDDSGLSRRHVVIEIDEGIVQVSDCGSLNGTFLNNEKVTGPTVLKDQDVISIGDVYQIAVRIAYGRGNQISTPTDPEVAELVPDSHEVKWTNRPIVAAIAIAVILLTAGTLAALRAGRGSVDTLPASDGLGQGNDNSAKLSSGDTVGADKGDTAGSGTVSAERIESEAVQVLLRATADRHPYEFPPEALAGIRESIERYCKVADLPPALRSIARHRVEIAADVARRGQGLEPSFVVYAALAQADGGRTGSDYVAIVKQMIPTLVTLGITFGTDADSSLIVLAAQTIGPGTRTSHPLLPKIRQLIKSNPSAKRSVWYLYERNGITREAYSFVVRFIALGIIAQNPRQFGIDADALVF